MVTFTMPEVTSTGRNPYKITLKKHKAQTLRYAKNWGQFHFAANSAFEPHLDESLFSVNRSHSACYTSAEG